MPNIVKYLKCRENFGKPCYVGAQKCMSTSSAGNSTTAIKLKARKLNPNENYGQPTPWTHPHMLTPGEIVPGITLDEIRMRRNNLALNIQKFAVDQSKALKKHLIVIPSSTKKYMSDKIPYVFRQSSDFMYLTGCLEPDSVLLLLINEKSEPKSILFMRPKDKHAELWDGPRTGVDQSVDYFGVDEAYDVEQLEHFIQRYLRTETPLTLWYDKRSSDQEKITKILETAAKTLTPSTTESPTAFIHKMRLIKSPAEINLMRTTCEIASESINQTIADTRPGDCEHHIFSRVDHYCRMRNASFLAYPPVVAAGKNATTIHYINNNQLARNGELVLMDAGCEYAGYTSDITRTWPVNGHFSTIQKVLYEVLLTVQKELINTLLTEGGRTLDDLFDAMCMKLGKYLQEIGLIPKNLKTLDLAKVAYSFCPHHVSHYLGMDVHDTPLISRSIPLLPGMVCTVEPGIYIASDRMDVPTEFRGIGMRIEDDVLIQSSNSVEVLTQKCVKEIVDLENLAK